MIQQVVSVVNANHVRGGCLEKKGTSEPLNRLGESMIIDPHVHETVNYFISLLYSSKSDGDVNVLRYKLLCQK